MPARDFPAMPDLPNWFNMAPRFGTAYDLTGDAKTALKGTVNQYYRSFPVDIAALRSGNAATDTRNWPDCDYLPGTSTCSTLVSADQPRRYRPGQRDRSEQQRTVRCGARPHFDPEASDRTTS